MKALGPTPTSLGLGGSTPIGAMSILAVPQAAVCLAARITQKGRSDGATGPAIMASRSAGRCVRGKGCTSVAGRQQLASAVAEADGIAIADCPATKDQRVAVLDEGSRPARNLNRFLPAPA